MSIQTGTLMLPAVPARPWLRWYDAGVPDGVDVPDSALPRYLAVNAVRYPNRPVIRYYGRSITYGQLDADVNRFAHALIALGVNKGDRVALLLPNCPQMVIAFYGAWRAGAVVVPTSPLAAQTEMVRAWNVSQVSVIVCLSSLYTRVDRACRALQSNPHVIVANIKEYFPTVTRVLFTLALERRGGHRVDLPRDGRTHPFGPLLGGASTRAPRIEVSGRDLALLQATGGTTGSPKLAMLTHRNLLANALQVRAWMRNSMKPDCSDVIFGVVPLFHIYGVTTVLNHCLVNGATMVLQPQFLLKDVLKALDRECPDFFPGVPTMYMAVNNAPNLRKFNLRSLKSAISGAASLPHEVQTEFERLTGAKLVEGYGLTEAGPVTHCTPLQGRRKLGSIGLPLPGTDAAIVDAEEGTHVLGVGQIGELRVRGPQVMMGYWREPGETAGVLRDGWLYTGDLATVDEDGYFSIVDRKKDLIISGGLNVYPREVEEPLYDHPKVREAVAVGVPDPTWGEAVKVYIVLKDGEQATPEEIIAYCRQHMARYKVPKAVEFRSSLPENLVGKVLRRLLVAEERAKTARPG